jgi:hypothetical protein
MQKIAPAQFNNLRWLWRNNKWERGIIGFEQ